MRATIAHLSANHAPPLSAVGPSATVRLSRASDWVSYPLVKLAAGKYSSVLRTPEHFLRMLLLIEDKRFLVHPGVDPLSVIRALTFNARGGLIQGASTVTQQLYNIRRRNVWAARRGWTYKFKQSLWALSSSVVSRKSDLLNEYVDTVYWGRSYYGLDQAAEGYFGATRGSLNAAQSFLLAERIAAPNAVCPRRILNLMERGSVRNSLELGQATIFEVAALYQRVYGRGGSLWAIRAR